MHEPGNIDNYCMLGVGYKEDDEVRQGFYVSKCGECICEYSVEESGHTLQWSGGDYFPMNLTKLRKLFIYLGEP